ncbi:MAG: sulfatase-like hydrolase/transferase [Candidatus Poribacteria bacterium]|nr:sulfatase-like hydrolase/transferase [Candidatus Poribacteria bacterium]
MRKPNIIFLFTDDQRFDTIGGLNNPAIKTPNLDRLVAEGTTFTNAYIMGGSSGAVCMPSRGMLHTGRSLYHIQGRGESVDPNHAMLGETLQQAGYTSFGTGKWHNGPSAFARSFNAGAEIFFGGMDDHWNVPTCDYDPTGEYRPTPKIDNPHVDNTVTWRRCDHIATGKHSTDLFVDATINFIEQQPTEDPFLAYVSFMAPHDPRSMPEEFLQLYDPDQIDLPINFMPQHPFDNGWMTGRDEKLAGFPRTKSEVRRHIAEYYAITSHLDAAVGRLRDALNTQGILEETIIVFAGDNGLAVGQHGLMGKQNLYDHSVHVPLIFSGPSIPKGEQRDALVYLIDIFPTLCDLTQTPIPETVEGNSLQPVLDDSENNVRTYLHFAFLEAQRGIRDSQYKLIEYAVGGSHTQTQLFDLIHDPKETQNLVDDLAYAEIRQRLRDQLKQWQTIYGDTREHGQAFWSAYTA